MRLVALIASLAMVPGRTSAMQLDDVKIQSRLESLRQAREVIVGQVRVAEPGGVRLRVTPLGSFFGPLGRAFDTTVGPVDSQWLSEVVDGIYVLTDQLPFGKLTVEDAADLETLQRLLTFVGPDEVLDRVVGAAHPGGPFLEWLVDDHLRTPAPWMTYERLLRMYRRADARRGAALRAMATAGHREARPLFLSILSSPEPRDEIISEERKAAAEGLREIGASEDVPALVEVAARYGSVYDLCGILELASEAQTPSMFRLLRTYDATELPLLAPWFLTHGRRTALDVVRARRIAPKVHVNIAEADSDAVAADDGAVLALASLGDPEILEWAERALSGPPLEHSDVLGWRALLPVRVIARSPLVRAFELGKRIEQGGGEHAAQLREARGERDQCGRQADQSAPRRADG